MHSLFLSNLMMGIAKNNYVLLLWLPSLAVSYSEYAPAEQCDYNECVRPACVCSSFDVPGNLEPKKIPQIVSLTFDDAVTPVNYRQYEELLFNRTNPNGCPITSTFFLSHVYTDYTLVHDLWVRRNEIGSHSISHNITTKYWQSATKELWREEIVGMKEMATIYGNIPQSEVKGMRAPFLDMGGNNMYEMLYENGFTYDNSWPTQQSTHLWPYTLDYASKQKCQIYPCPQTTPNVSLPGLWILPMIDLYGDNGSPCAMLDTCIVEHTEEAVFNMLMRNFKERYDGDRGHFGLFQHSAWFQYPGHYDAMVKFLDFLHTLDDVYIVSMENFLAWTKSPTGLDRIREFKPWLESCTPRKSNCRKNTCYYDNPPQLGVSEVYLISCFNDCPDNYPYVGNPKGESI